MTQPRPLYLANSLAGLRAQITFRHRPNQPLTLRRLKKLYKEAENEIRRYLQEEGDQEQAYLAYSRALEYLNLMTKCEEYEQQPVSESNKTLIAENLPLFFEGNFQSQIRTKKKRM